MKDEINRRSRDLNFKEGRKAAKKTLNDDGRETPNSRSEVSRKTGR